MSERNPVTDILKIFAVLIVCAIWLPPFHPFWISDQVHRLAATTPAPIALPLMALVIAAWTLLLNLVAAVIVIVIEQTLPKLVRMAKRRLLASNRSRTTSA